MIGHGSYMIETKRGHLIFNIIEIIAGTVRVIVSPIGLFGLWRTDQSWIYLFWISYYHVGGYNWHLDLLGRL